MSDVIREKFEEWASVFYGREPVREYDNGDGYESETLSIAWEGWKASRASTSVQLPEQEWFGNDDAGGFAYDPDAVIAALSSAGIKIE